MHNKSSTHYDAYLNSLDDRLMGNMAKPTVAPTKSDDQYGLKVVSRAVQVLFAFSSEEPSLTLEDLSNKLQVNKTSLLRILRSFEAEGLIARSGDVYRLGAKVMDLANLFLATLSVHSMAQPFMKSLATHTRQTISLAVLEEFEIVYIAIEQAQREVGIQGEIGGRHPANATALGKVLLAHLPAERLSERLSNAQLKRLTHRTITDSERLKAHLKLVKEQGYADDDEERGIGIRCIAAPIFDYTGSAVAGLSIAGPIFHMTDEDLVDYRQRLLQAAAQLSRELGYSAASDKGVLASKAD
jgi:IclR family KDG regulon transcriptional repressor